MADKQPERRRWPLSQAWTAVLSVTATAYALDIEALGAPSRGRGPRPPKTVWEARKVAVYLVVVLSDQNHAAVARHIGFHRDTVNSHCLAMREAVLDDLDMEERVGALRVAAAAAAAQISENRRRMKKGVSSDGSSDDEKKIRSHVIVIGRAAA